ISAAGCRVRSMSGKGGVPSNCWTNRRNSGSSPWFVANPPKATPVGPYVWSPSRPSSGNWCPKWAARRRGSCCSATTSSRGGKKMWCVAELNQEYIQKMEDVLATYEKPYTPAEPVDSLDEKPVSLHADI